MRRKTGEVAVFAIELPRKLNAFLFRLVKFLKRMGAPSKLSCVNESPSPNA